MSHRIDIYRHTLEFQLEANTSRGRVKNKPIYILKWYNTQEPEVFGIGECSPLEKLSIDAVSDYETYLFDFCKYAVKYQSIDFLYEMPLSLRFPSILFGLEMAWKDLQNGGCRMVFDNDFSRGRCAIPINGLIWMNHSEHMKEQIKHKLKAGFECIKIKIGNLNFEAECELLSWLRSEDKSCIIRLDANGAFAPEEALQKLEVLSEFRIHSIEQPIRPNQRKTLKALCKKSPIPIALDEELIGLNGEDFLELLDDVAPPMLIFKPNLIGGMRTTDTWIREAEERGIFWWATSSLESNIGLSALCQWVAQKETKALQGLGTGQVYANNIPSPLVLEKTTVRYDNKKSWDLGCLQKVHASFQ